MKNEEKEISVPNATVAVRVGCVFLKSVTNTLSPVRNLPSNVKRTESFQRAFIHNVPHTKNEREGEREREVKQRGHTV